MKMHNSRRKQHLWTEMDLPAVTRICFSSTHFSPFSHPHHCPNTKYAVWEKDYQVFLRKHMAQCNILLQALLLSKSWPGIYLIYKTQSKRARPLEEAPSDQEALVTHHCPIPLRQKSNSTGKESFYSDSSFKWHCESQRVKGSFILTLQGTNHKLLHNVFYTTKGQKSTTK